MIETRKNMFVHADTANKQGDKLKEEVEFCEALNEAHRVAKWALNRGSLTEIEKEGLPQACSKFTLIANKHGDTQIVSWDLEPEMPTVTIEREMVVLYIDGQREWECDLE